MNGSFYLFFFQILQKNHKKINICPEISVLMSTSGSTGDSKFVALSKQNISSEENQIFQQKVKNYYKESNLKFFEVTKLTNKYLY